MKEKTCNLIKIFVQLGCNHLNDRKESLIVFKADYAEMKSSAVTIAKSASEYKDNVSSLYDLVDSLAEIWEGEDNLAFVEKANSYKNTLLSLGDVVNNYSIFLNKAVDVISETQDNNTAAAKRL